MQLNTTLMALCILSLFGSLNLAVAETEKDPYVNALGQEANRAESKAEADDKKDSSAGAKATAQKNVDQDKLTEKVIDVLEKSLGKTPATVKDSAKDVEKAVKQKESSDLRQGLQSVVSDALNEGANIDDIRAAVETALLGIQKRKPSIKAEELQSADQILRDILASGSKLAAGDPGDAYIASLKGELEDLTVTAKDEADKKKVSEAKTTKDQSNSDKKEAAKKSSLSTEKSKEKIASTVTQSPSAQGKSGDEYVSNLKQEAKVTFITIQEGDTLSKIAVRVYGSTERYADIFKANQDIINNPNHLLPGQVLKVPK